MSPCRGLDGSVQGWGHSGLGRLLSEEQKITLRAWEARGKSTACAGILPVTGVGVWGWHKAQGQVTDRGAPRSLGLSGRRRDGREKFEPFPAGSGALLRERFPSAVTIPISGPQALRLGGSGRCEVLSPGGVRANCCKILCTKNSCTSGQFKAARAVQGPDLGRGFKSLQINLLSAPFSFSARCLMRPTRLGSDGT